MSLNKQQIYITLLLLSLGHFVVDFMIGILPVYKTMQNLDIATVGIIAGLCAFIGEGVQVFFGPLGDRGFRKCLVMLGILGTIASVCFAYTSDYFLLFVLYLITCIGSGAFHPSAVSIISNLTATQKSFFISIFAASGAFGIASSQLVFSNTFMFLHGHTLALGIPSMLLVLFMSRYLISAPTSSLKPSEGHLSLFYQFFKKKALRNLYITSVCNQALFWGLIFLLPDALKAKGYESWMYLGGGHLFLILGAGCMLVPAGLLADRISPRAVILCAIMLAITSLYTFLFIPELPPMAACGLLFSVGASIGLVNPVCVAFGNELMPDHPGVVNACLMGLVWCVAEGIGQTGGGLLTTLFDSAASVKALMLLGALAFPEFVAAYALPKEAKEVETIELT